MRRRARVRLFSALLSVASAAHAQSAEKASEIEDLDLVGLLNVEVSTASKTAESIEEAAAVITVVTRADIERWGYQSVAEVLQHTVGFYLIDDHILPNTGVRGMTGGLGAESGVIKVMIDGRSVAYRRTSGNWLGVELVPLESVHQIEIIRGPASALYGADAFLGVVNIITLPPDQLRPIRARATVGLTEGNPGTRFDVASGTRLGRFDFLLGAAGELTDRSGLVLPSTSPAPRLPDDVGNRRFASNLTRRSLVLQSRIGYREQRVGELVLSAYASGFERGGDFAHWAQLTNVADPERTRGTIVSLGQFRVNFDGVVHATPELDLAVSSTYFQGGVLPRDRIDVANRLFYVERNESYRGVDALAEARFTPSDRFTLIFGVETIFDREDLESPHRVDPVTNLPVPEQREERGAIDFVDVGAYVSSSYKLLDPWLKLTGGMRYDHHSEYAGQLTGRVGLTSRLSRALTAKLLYGSAFKAPSPYLLHAEPLRLGDVIGNPDLEPQRVHTLEYQTSFRPSRFFWMSSAISHSWLLDKAEFTPQGQNQTARNAASQRSLSWETSANVAHYEDYTAYLSFELVHSVRELGEEGYFADLVGHENVAYPPWIVRGGGVVSVPSPPEVPLTLGLEGILVGPRRAADASIVEHGAPYSLPAHFLLDASLATREIYLAPGHESRVALRSRNLLRTRGADPGFSGFEYPLAPAELFLELRHTY
ncbi:MAG: TonB-dependent receptor [Pseudomonadota bacterium]|nr:MAG: TonB-dependent receptor [Pseudomonadota bacterium]